jgi:hypothetical protein
VPLQCRHSAIGIRMYDHNGIYPQRFIFWAHFQWRKS